MIQSARFAADELDSLALKAAAGDRAAEAQVIVGVVDLAWCIGDDATTRTSLERAFDDIFGDVLVEAVRAVRRYDGRGRISRYIGSTLRSAVRGHTRRYLSRIGAAAIPVRGRLDFTRGALSAPGLYDDAPDRRNDDDGDRRLDLPVLRERVARLLSALDSREREVVRRRFGLYGSEPETQRYIAAAMGISHQRVAQIERAAMYRLGARATP